DIGFRKRRLDLVPDRDRHLLFALRLQPAGIDEVERTTIPFRPRKVAIARHTGHVFDNGAALAEHAVEERGLPYVGAADDGNDRKTASHVLPGADVIPSTDNGRLPSAEVISWEGSSRAGASADSSALSGMLSMKSTSS